MIEDNVSKCPFCKWHKFTTFPQRVGDYRRKGTKWQVVCNKCRARGPLCETFKEADLAWLAVSEMDVFQ
jgi:hypothetical protein